MSRFAHIRNSAEINCLKDSSMQSHNIMVCPVMLLALLLRSVEQVVVFVHETVQALHERGTMSRVARTDGARRLSVLSACLLFSFFQTHFCFVTFAHRSFMICSRNCVRCYFPDSEIRTIIWLLLQQYSEILYRKFDICDESLKNKSSD